MESGSCVSEPVLNRKLASALNRSALIALTKTGTVERDVAERGEGGVPVQRSPSSMTAGGSPTSTTGKPRMAQLETLEAKMANIEVSLSSATRRRKSGSGSVSCSGASVRSSPRPETAAATPTPPSKELRSALQDREAVIQNLRVQLGLGKLPRPVAPLDESDRPAAEQRLHRVKVDTDNKRIAIRNLKTALDKLDITDNIDVRIRQAELEYALGREELQLLSLVEEAQAIQSRLEKGKPDSYSLYQLIQNGTNLSLHAVNPTVGRWAATTKNETNALCVEWALEGEGLYRGDRIIEVNGKIVSAKCREETQRLIGFSGKCQLVVLRQKSAPIVQHQQLIQSQEDNLRLQHRISYLEEQVKELQEVKETVPQQKNSHVTNISISSPPVTPPDKTEIFQRGNFITTIVGGKPLRSPPPPPPKSSSASSTSSSASVSSQLQSIMKNSTNHSAQMYLNNNHHQQPQSNNVTKTTIIKENGHHKHHLLHQLEQQKLSSSNKYGISVSQMSINTDMMYKKERDRREREKELRREIRERFIQNHNKNRICNGFNLNRSSGENLNYLSSDKRREILLEMSRRNANNTINDLRSVKSLDFDSDFGGSATEGRHHKSHHHHHTKEVDYTSEPHGPRSMRPMPPKKPLRLSLQRAQSLQTVEGSMSELDKKKGMKRTYRGDKTPELSQFIEHSSNISLHTASLGRHKYV